MAYTLFDHVNIHGENTFKTWTKKLQDIQLGKLNQKLDSLAMNGDELFPLTLAPAGAAGIFKLKVKGNVQLRPMLCRGPVNNETEYTLLLGAKEIGGKYDPKEADLKADQLKSEVKVNPAKRRIDHERVSPKNH